MACRLLFGARLDPAFLEHVQESGLRAAWRRKALQTHPDRTTDVPTKVRNNERFIEARRAYGLLREYLGSRDPVGHAPGPGAHRHGQRPPQRPRAQRPSPHRPGDRRPVAGVPRRRLRLGEFLYHSRVITFSDLIETLVFQRRQRERFCEIVLRWRCLSEVQVQTLLARRRPLERIGEAAQRLRLLSALQVRLVLTYQRRRQEPLGKLFVRRGLLTGRHLEEQLSRLSDHNSSQRRD
ncbi:MAG: J domain-containing protein [Candidatus Methylomirabilia bacterium]